MKGQLSFTSRPILLIMTIAVLTFLLFGLTQQQESEKKMENNIDLREATTNTLGILSGSQDCLALVTSATQGVYAHIASKERLDMFASKYQGIEPECARNFAFGWRATVEELGGEKGCSQESTQTQNVPVQIVAIVDSSQSMANDALDLANLPPKIQELKAQGYNIEFSAYLLTGRGSGGSINCANLPGLNCRNLSSSCTLSGFQSEDWGDGVSCIAQLGPEGGWKAGAKRVILALSDAVSAGNCDDARGTCDIEGAFCAPNKKSLENGIAGAKQNSVNVYGLEAKDLTSHCIDTLGKMMERIASETGGRHIKLADANEVSNAIAQVATEHTTTIQQQTCMNWTFGAGEFSQSLSLRERAKESLPIGIAFSGKDVRIGRITVDMVDGDLERVSGFIDESCILGEKGTTQRSAQFDTSLPIRIIDSGTASQACLVAGNLICKPLMCRANNFELPAGRQLVETTYSGGRVQIDA